MAKKRQELSFVAKMARLRKAGVQGSKPLRAGSLADDLPSLDQRIAQVLGLLNNQQTNPRYMTYFVMYDIESNKVRNLVAKYLIRKGCTRVQKSIFVANTERAVFNEIQTDLKEVQACYDNNDSILLVPVSTDELRAMKIIGQNIDFEMVMKNRNTLFF